MPNNSRANQLAAIMGLNAASGAVRGYQRDQAYSNYLDRLDEQDLQGEAKAAGFNDTQLPESVKIGRSPLGSLLAMVGILDKNRPLNEREKAAYSKGQLEQEDVRYTRGHRQEAEIDRASANKMKKLSGLGYIYNMIGKTGNVEEGARLAQESGLEFDPNTGSLIADMFGRSKELEDRLKSLQISHLEKVLSETGDEELVKKSKQSKALKASAGYGLKEKTLNQMLTEYRKAKSAGKNSPDRKTPEELRQMAKSIDDFQAGMANDIMNAARMGNVMIDENQAAGIVGYPIIPQADLEEPQVDMIPESAHSGGIGDFLRSIGGGLSGMTGGFWHGGETPTPEPTPMMSNDSKKVQIRNILDGGIR